MLAWIFLALLHEACAMGEFTRCETAAATASWRDRNTVAETSLKTLAGTWISEGCETRPGPEYILRSYTFTLDGVYNLIQHHYWDDSCSSPKLTLISHGKIKLRNSLMQPEAFNGFPKPINITVIPQDDSAAEELNTLVTKHCPGRYWKSWKRNDEHLVYDNRQERRGTFNLWSQSYQPIGNHYPANKHNTHHVSGDISCLGSLKWAFNDLKLLKIQFRPILHKHAKQVEMELLLGDIHSNKKRREFYSPTSFQTPLLRQTKGENITIRHDHFIVVNSNAISTNLINYHPPHLIEKAHLPPYIWGQWTSSRCESRPQNVYLTRLFSFFENDFSWIGEHKFYSDPFCLYPKFIITATGRFSLAGPSGTMNGVTNIDFQIEQATLTALDENVIREMSLPGFCGEGKWKVNVPKELSTTGGCLYLGIFIPSIQFDVVKVEVDYKGAWLLFLGQPDTDNLPSSINERPTAFQLPLVKCGEKVSFSERLKEHLEGNLYFSSGSRSKLDVFALCNLILYFIFR